MSQCAENRGIEDIVCDANNLFEASERVIKSSPKKYATVLFKQKRLSEIKRAQTELHNRTWQIKPMKPFVLNERGHTRKIIGNTPYDRMIIHSYLDYGLEPILRKYLIYDNYASQKGKGTDLARNRFMEFLHRAYREYGHNKFYVLLIDFAKFYDNVQHEKLIDEIMKKVPYDGFHVYMLSEILHSMRADVSFLSDEECASCIDKKYSSIDHIDENRGIRYMDKGLQIGNQASQLFSIFYPARIDTYCRCVLGLRYHGRYMDDTFIMSDKKDVLRHAVDGISKISDEMGLFVHERKTQIHRIDRGVKYLNRVYSMTETGHIFERLHRSTFTRQVRKLKKMPVLIECGKPFTEVQNQYKSWIGNFRNQMTQNQLDVMNETYNKLFINNWR